MSEDTHDLNYARDAEYADMAAEVFSLLCDPTRVRIILALREGECSVGELAELIGKSPTVISQHLAKLRLGRIVTFRHVGNRSHYCLVDEHARTLVEHAIYQVQHVVEDLPRHHRDSLITLTPRSAS